MRIPVVTWLLAPALAFVPVQQMVAPEAPASVSAVLEAAAPTAVAATRLQADLERLIESPGWPGDRWGVIVVSLDRGDTLFSHGADEALTPASNLKLFTTAAALYYLGPEFRYSTFLLSDGKIENGVLNGDVVVYGTGDPSFSSRFGRRDGIWHAFADTLATLGVKEIRGAVVGDGSYFAGSGTGAGWQESYMNASYAAPSSALSYADNIATLQIKPAAQAGWRPEISLIDGADGIAIVNEAQTVGRGRSWINATRTAYDGPVLVRGQVSRATVSISRTIPVSDPPRYAAAVFRQILIDKGIQVTGGVRSVTREEDSPVTGRVVFAPALDANPPVRVLAIYQSPPLIDVLEIINKKSHNLMAEQTIRTVGRVAQGDGSVAGGYHAVQQLLVKETGTTPHDLHMDDGSGLSVLDRTSARTVVHLLSFMAKSPMWGSYWQTLPEAGVAGGLQRMRGTAAQSNLKAKTGTIDRVSALSGYVRAANGERLAFSIISNNVPSTWRAKRIEDAIGVRLASFNRDNDSATALVPDPGERPSRANASRASGRSYKIRKGDTLSEIAERNRTSVAAIQRANPGLRANRLLPGKRIRLP
jgi:D-alanyl-D-alanine carboxypeptidase/D-alanyl-D-alanine-endopeptidase (penicillin-binding protein 4)